ncbi:MAG: hypothetical protein AAF513_15330 [Pseudomonadota bacterium]
MLRSNKRPLSADLGLGLLLIVLLSIDRAEAASFDFDLEVEQTEQEPAWQNNTYVEARGQYFAAGEAWESSRVTAHTELKWGRYAGVEQTQWRGFVSGRVEHDERSVDYRAPARAELVEAYLLRDGATTDITLGKQRVAWGTADGVSTIDRINAVDLRDPIGNARTASRRPSWLLRIEQKLQTGSLDFVWLPRGRDRKFPEFGSPWEPSGLNELRMLRRAGAQGLEIEDPHRPEGGVRYQVFGQGVDWSVAFFNGYTDGPVRARTVAASPGAALLRLSPVRVSTVNIAGALGLARSTLRGEVAYTADTWVDSRPSDLWQMVLGWDQTFFTSLYVNLQLYYDRATAAPDTYGATFAITQQVFDDAATMGLRGQVGNDAQHAIEAFLDYRLGDQLLLSAKYLSFDGARSSPLGDFRDNDFAALTVRWDV